MATNNQNRNNQNTDKPETNPPTSNDNLKVEEGKGQVSFNSVIDGRNNHYRCEEVALRLFAERSVTARHTSAPILIFQAFKDAQTFLDISSQIAKGEVSIDKPTTRLQDASAPNLPPTHPMNLVSQRFVDKNGGTEEAVLARITAIVKHLNANPMLGRVQDGESDPGPTKVTLSEIDLGGGEIIHVNWTNPDIRTARLILPEVLKEQPA